MLDAPKRTMARDSEKPKAVRPGKENFAGIAFLIPKTARWSHRCMIVTLIVSDMSGKIVSLFSGREWYREITETVNT
jgi:hypothetical protein